MISSGIETSCDETAAAVVDRGRTSVLSSVVASQAELHARYGGVVPEVASRRHLELVSPVVRAALEDAGIGFDDVERVGVTQGPGLVGALLVGLSAAKALAWARGIAARPGRPPPRPRRDPLPRPGSARAAVHVPPRERGPHAGALRPGQVGLRRARLDARRRGGRGVRQGGEAARPRVSRRRRDRPSRRRRAIPRRLRSRWRGSRASTSRSPGLKTALLYAVRELAERRARAHVAPTWRPRTSARSSARSSEGFARAPTRPATATIAVVGGVAANSELRAALPDARFAPLNLCTDNAAMVASAARFARPLASPDYLALDAYSSTSCSSSARACGARRRLCGRAWAAPRERRTSSRAPRDGRVSSAAVRCPSSAGAGSSSCGRRRSLTGSGAPVAGPPSSRCEPGRRPCGRHSSARSRGSRPVGRRSSPSSRTSAS